MRKVFAVLAVLLAISAAMQLYFAAIGVFSNPEDHLFAIHGINGQYVLRILALLLVIVGLVGKVGKQLVWWSAWVLILSFVQLLLFILAGVLFGASREAETVPMGATVLLGLHGLVGLVMIGLAFAIAGRSVKAAFPRGAKDPAPVT